MFQVLNSHMWLLVRQYSHRIVSSSPLITKPYAVSWGRSLPSAGVAQHRGFLPPPAPPRPLAARRVSAPPPATPRPGIGACWWVREERCAGARTPRRRTPSHLLYKPRIPPDSTTTPAPRRQSVIVPTSPTRFSNGLWVAGRADRF